MICAQRPDTYPNIASTSTSDVLAEAQATAILNPNHSTGDPHSRSPGAPNPWARRQQQQQTTLWPWIQTMLLLHSSRKSPLLHMLQLQMPLNGTPPVPAQSLTLQQPPAAVPASSSSKSLQQMTTAGSSSISSSSEGMMLSRTAQQQ